MITTLQTTLERLRGERAKQAKVVEDLEAPIKRLRDLEAQEAAAAAALEQAAADRAQLEAELFDCRRFLDHWSPREGKLRAAVEALDSLADAATHGMLRGIDQYAIGRASATCRSHLEYMETRRTERKRIETALKELGGK